MWCGEDSAGGKRRLTVDDFGEDLYRKLVHEACDIEASGADRNGEGLGSRGARPVMFRLEKDASRGGSAVVCHVANFERESRLYMEDIERSRITKILKQKVINIEMFIIRFQT